MIEGRPEAPVLLVVLLYFQFQVVCREFGIDATRNLTESTFVVARMLESHYQKNTVVLFS